MTVLSHFSITSPPNKSTHTLSPQYFHHSSNRIPTTNHFSYELNTQRSLIEFHAIDNNRLRSRKWHVIIAIGCVTTDCSFHSILYVNEHETFRVIHQLIINGMMFTCCTLTSFYLYKEYLLLTHKVQLYSKRK